MTSFFRHQWIFITDTVDAVYRPDDWHPEAMMDQLSEIASSLGVGVSDESPDSFLQILTSTFRPPIQPASKNTPPRLSTHAPQACAGLFWAHCIRSRASATWRRSSRMSASRRTKASTRAAEMSIGTRWRRVSWRTCLMVDSSYGLESSHTSSLFRIWKSQAVVYQL